MNLVLNGLPFRGDYENSNFQSGTTEGSVYLSTFTDLLFKANPKLNEIAKKLPGNAKYTTLQVQNELIDTLYGLVKEKIAKAIKKTYLFTVMMGDGTTEETGHELIGIVARYIDADTGKVAEHIVDIKDGDR